MELIGNKPIKDIKSTYKVAVKNIYYICTITE